MKPRFLSIKPDPDEHSGHWRLQLLVNSVLMDTGMAYISVLLVAEPLI